MAVPAARAATMSTPGAVMSGFTARSPTRGPRLENGANASSRSTAPTVSALVALPGEPTVLAPFSPELPADTTNSVPVSSVSAFTAWLSGSVPSVGSPPRLMLTTSAPDRAAHSIPASTHDSMP